METTHFDEIKGFEDRLDNALKNVDLVKDTAASKDNELENLKKTINQKDLEIEQMKNEDSHGEELNNHKKTIQEKNEEIQSLKSDHLKEIDELKSIQTGNTDLNLKRLKKMYADMKKDKLKVEETLKKDLDVLKKQKAALEEEIITGSKESKNKDEERMTILKIFEGMQELMGKMNNQTLNTNTPVSEFVCDSCDYKTNNSAQLKQHKDDQHGRTVLYACNICDKKCTDIDSLKIHKRSHVKKKYECKDCRYKAETGDELKEHITRR